MYLDLQNFGDFLNAYNHAVSFQEGGQADPQQAQQEVFAQTVQAIAQGVNPSDVFKQLQEAGVPQEQAAQIVEQAVEQAKQMQAQQQSQGDLQQFLGGGENEMQLAYGQGTLSPANSTRITTTRTMDNVANNKFNRSLVGLNKLASPESPVNLLKNTGLQGFIKGATGALGAVSGMGLGVQKIFSGSNVDERIAPEGTQVKKDAQGNQFYVSPEESERLKQESLTAWQKPTGVNSEGNPLQPIDFGMPTFENGAEVKDLDSYQFAGVVYGSGLSPYNMQDFIKANQNVNQQNTQQSEQPNEWSKKTTVWGDPAGQKVAMNTLNGLAMLNQTLGAGKEERKYKQDIRDAFSTDAMASTNAYNPFGYHTTNDQNFKGFVPNMGAVQDFGTYMNTAENGGDIQDFGAYLPDYMNGSDVDYEEGGEYELSESQIRQILANGGEIEFL
jgi:hypothetical protein